MTIKRINKWAQIHALKYLREYYYYHGCASSNMFASAIEFL